MKLLVAAASRHEATREIGDRLAATLRGRGLVVDCRPVESVTSVGGYDAVLLGSAIYAGQWLAAARALVERHAEELRCRPVWLFSSGPLQGTPHDPLDHRQLRALLAASGAREHRVFEGRMQRSRLSAGERVVATVVRASEGDFRDWRDVEAWAHEVADQLGAPPLPREGTE
jgi:menaquinone-dependent protoporphyrinogen oxidase